MLNVVTLGSNINTKFFAAGSEILNFFLWILWIKNFRINKGNETMKYMSVTNILKLFEFWNMFSSVCKIVMYSAEGPMC